VVVLDQDNGNVVGIVSLGDLASNTRPDASGELLQEITTGYVKTH
jgi:hypothetical protein